VSWIPRNFVPISRKSQTSIKCRKSGACILDVWYSKFLLTISSTYIVVCAVPSQWAPWWWWSGWDRTLCRLSPHSPHLGSPRTGLATPSCPPTKISLIFNCSTSPHNPRVGSHKTTLAIPSYILQKFKHAKICGRMFRTKFIRALFCPWQAAYEFNPVYQSFPVKR
jgi:hypothetical protein